MTGRIFTRPPRCSRHKRHAQGYRPTAVHRLLRAFPGFVTATVQLRACIQTVLFSFPTPDRFSRRPSRKAAAHCLPAHARQGRKHGRDGRLRCARAPRPARPHRGVSTQMVHMYAALSIPLPPPVGQGCDVVRDESWEQPDDAERPLASRGTSSPPAPVPCVCECITCGFFTASGQGVLRATHGAPRRGLRPRVRA